MANWNLSFYQDETGYTDGSIENELLEIVKETDDYQKVLASDNRWAMMYHLSALRQNILNWYPFDNEASLLEIGGGCGALTDLFCQRVKKVTTVELTKIRSEINLERNKKFNNLEIITGNFNNVILTEKYDYIILNGVLEYAGSFTEGDTPYEDFLLKIKKLLKPEGRILVAIENRIGLKYLNGAPEDHTNELFSGINDYRGIDFVKTFTKNELINLFEMVGLEKHRFYYPVPDYKLPEVIYTDHSLDLMNANIKNCAYNASRLTFYNESSLFETLLDEDIIDHFFNSYLIEIGNYLDDEASDSVIYAKMGNRRKSEFSIMTRIFEKNGEQKVQKNPLNETSQIHLNKMVDYYNTQNNDAFRKAPIEIVENGIEVPFIEGETLEKVLLFTLEKQGKDEFLRVIHKFKDRLFEKTEPKQDYCVDRFKKVFGNTNCNEKLLCKKNANIDLIFSNFIVEAEDQYTMIDYEWVFDFWIPQEFVFWRSIYYLYLGNEEVKKQFTLTSLLQEFNLSEKLHQCFKNWDFHFGSIYVKDQTFEQYEKPVVDIGGELNERLKDVNWTSSLYLDFGTGYSEENCLKSVLTFDEEQFTVSFKMNGGVTESKKRIHSIRWDPCEHCCILRDIAIMENNNDLDFEPINHTMIKDNEIFFMTNDPMFDLSGDYEGIEILTFSGRMKELTTEEVLVVLSNENRTLHNEIKNLKQKFEHEKEILEQEYFTVTNSSIWRVSAPVRKILDKLK